MCGELGVALDGLHGLDRFIPACAGNSLGSVSPAKRLPVHPRVCGELHKLTVYSISASGSSPRVRGTRRQFPRRLRLHRFIPACAGNSRPRCRPRNPQPVHPRVCGELGRSARTHAFPSPVHPRVCGELAVGRWPISEMSGSSPRVRGTPPHRRGAPNRRRFIPACAGNSWATT